MKRNNRGETLRLWNDNKDVVAHNLDAMNMELWNIEPEVLSWDAPLIL